MVGSQPVPIVRRVHAQSPRGRESLSVGALSDPLRPCIDALARVRTALASAVRRGCQRSREAARNAIHDAVRSDQNLKSIHACKMQNSFRCRRQPMTALLVSLTAGAAAGDRGDAFSDVVSAAREGLRSPTPQTELSRISEPQDGSDDFPLLCLLRSAYHDSVPAAFPAVQDVLKAAPKHSSVIVAFEDADCFSEDALRDIVYICSREHSNVARSVRIVLVFGLGISFEAVKNALGGGTDSTEIAFVSIVMPTPESSFDLIVEEIMDDRELPVLPTRSVFRAIRSDFLNGVTSVAMLEHAFYDVFASHFFDVPLAALLSHPDLLPAYLGDAVASKIDPDTPPADDSENRKQLLSQRLNTRMIFHFLSAGLMGSVARNLPDMLIEKAAKLAQFETSEKFRVLSENQARQELQKHVDRSQVIDLLFEWHEQLCLWRFKYFFVRSVLWDLGQVLRVFENEQSLLSLRHPESSPMSKFAVKILFLDECLPGDQAAISKSNSSSSSSRHSSIFRIGERTFIDSMLRTLDTISLSHLQTVTSVWIQAVERRSSVPKLENCAFVQLIEQLKDLSNMLARDSGHSRLERNDETMKDFGDWFHESWPVVSTNSKTEDSEKQSESLTVERRKSTIDKALESLENGLGSNRKRRAQGSLAALAKRAKDYRAVKVTPSPPDAASKARDRAKNLFKEMLCLVPQLQALPMYEVILYEDVHNLFTLSANVIGSAEPRSSLIRALRRPQDMLGSVSSSSTPDIAQAYQVFSEAGRLVNLSDWYHAFGSIRLSSKIKFESPNATEDRALSVMVGNDNPTSSESTPLDEEQQCQAQFARAVMELEFLGVLKHTNRKTDHVQRLLFE